MQTDKKYNTISVIILAAGYSSRMNGSLKALLPLEKKSILLELIEKFQTVGVDNIHIVLGHEHEQISSELKKHNISCDIVYNPDFAKGMFSSVAAGISSLSKDKNPEATFLIPVDAALVRTETISSLLDIWQEQPSKDWVIIPTAMGKCGHPPLIGHNHFARILDRYEQESKEKIEPEKSDGLQDLNALQEMHKLQKMRGLRGYFTSCLPKNAQDDFLKGIVPTIFSKERNTSLIQFIPFLDEGLIYDIDTQDDYQKALDFLEETANRTRPSIAEITEIMLFQNLPERILRHSFKVAHGALRLAQKLNKGLNNEKDFVNLYAVTYGALLHDICRTEQNHALVGANFLKSFGFLESAFIVGAHTVIPNCFLQKIGIDFEDCHDNLLEININKIYGNDERNTDLSLIYTCFCVYIADKFYAGDEHVSLKERFRKVEERHENDKEALKSVQKRKKIALSVITWFENISQVKAETCVNERSTHPLELRIENLFSQV